MRTEIDIHDKQEGWCEYRTMRKEVYIAIRDINFRPIVYKTVAA